MRYLTFLDYLALEAAGKSIDVKLAEKEKEIEAAVREAQETKKKLEEISLQQQIQTADATIFPSTFELAASFEIQTILQHVQQVQLLD
jgi:hypothetical protein